MLDLIVLNSVMLLALRRILKLRGLLLRKLYHYEALRDSVQLVLQHYHTFKVDRDGAFVSFGLLTQL